MQARRPGYARSRGVSHAVQTAADRAYDALPEGQQAIARQVLLAMMVTDRDGALARRPVARHDLYAGLPDADRGDIDAVLDAFAAARLAVLDGDTTQLSHDVLLWAWPRLRGWLEQDQASWIAHGRLADAAGAWRDSRQDPSFLYWELSWRRSSRPSRNGRPARRTPRRSPTPSAASCRPATAPAAAPRAGAAQPSPACSP